METNLLKAIKNISNLNSFDVGELYSGKNRMNNAGSALEYFVKDIFCSSLGVVGLDKKDLEHSKFLSYLGNQNNPPDFIIRNGDAIEVKKFTLSNNNGVALNSSYPKDYLYSDSNMISSACKNCEDWTKKDVVYAVGTISENIIKSIWFVYGNCYSADKGVYENIRYKISEGVKSLPDIEFGVTKELGRINKVDPLGITHLRIRGMWGIKHPNQVFYGIEPVQGKDFSMNSVMLASKYNSFPKEDREYIESSSDNGILVKDVKIKSPNNPAQYLDAKLISFKK